MQNSHKHATLAQLLQKHNEYFQKAYSYQSFIPYLKECVHKNL